MLSLKTEDIVGAKPRIRHAPRNLIRDQKLSQQYPQESMYPSYSDPYQYQYPYNQGSYAGSPPKNYDSSNTGYNIQPITNKNNDHTFVRKQAGLSGLNNIGMSQSFHEMSPQIAGKASYRINESVKIIDRYEEGKRPYIMPKDAPVVNYDEYQRKNPPPTTYTRAFSGMDRELYQKYQQNLSKSRESAPQPKKQLQSQPSSQLAPQQSYMLPKPQNPSSQKDQPRSRSSVTSSQIKSSKSSQQNMNAQQQKSKNLFRGLGYNIITNNKFSYDMENRFKNSISKWVE